MVENFKVILLGNTNVGKTCIFDRITRDEFNPNATASLAATFAAKKITVSNIFPSFAGGSRRSSRRSSAKHSLVSSDSNQQNGAAASGNGKFVTNGTFMEMRDQSDSIIDSHYRAASLKNSLRERDQQQQIPETQQVRLNMWDTVGTEKFMAINRQYFQEVACAMIIYDVTCMETFEGVDKWVDLVLENCPEHTLLVLVGNKIDRYKDQVVSAEKGEILAVDKDFDLYFEVSAKEGEGIDQLIQETGQLIWENIIEIREIQAAKQHAFKIKQQ